MDDKTLVDVEALSSQEKEFLKSSAASISTTSTEVEDEASGKMALNGTYGNLHLTPGRSLFINSRGIRMIQLPLPSSELETEILHPDGTLAYMSKREKRWSGNSVLSSPKVGELINTSYFFGPNRPPVLRLSYSATPGVNEIKVNGRWVSRTTTFEMPDGSTFQWRYVKFARNKDGRTNMVVLEKVASNGGARADSTSSNEGSGVHRIAQLVRTKDTIPENSSKHRAGAGGELILDQNAHLYLDEAVIVETCLVVLKREVDRRRAIQMMVMSGGGGGG